LRQIGDAPRYFPCPDLGGGEPAIAHRAIVGRPKIGENPQQDRLAGAVRPDETDHLARPHGKIDRLQERRRTKAHGDTLCLDLHHSSPRSR